MSLPQNPSLTHPNMLEMRVFAVYKTGTWVRFYSRGSAHSPHWGKYKDERLTNVQARAMIITLKQEGWG